jgi:hypothetical protein
MADKLIAVLSCLPNITYDLPIGAGQSDLSGKSNAGKSYVVFGKKDNTHAVELSDIAAGTGI